MILVTLGTQDKSFERLLVALEAQIKKGNIKEEVIVQAGYTKYDSKNMKIFDLISTDEFEELMDKCDLLITHGGVGSIVSGLKKNKKIIAVPRLKKYMEHTNDHQLEIINEFVNEGYILGVTNLSELAKVLKKVKKFKPKKFSSNTKNVVGIIENYIDSL